MIVASHKIIGFSLLFSLFSLGMAANAAPLPVIETLVEFSPETDSPPCRGVQISKNLIATSPVCAQKARETSNVELLEILTLSGEPLGFIAEQPGKLPENSMLLNIRLDTEARPGSYPVFYNASSVPGQAFTYSVDEKHQLVQLPVSLAIDETQSKSKFIISSKSSLPQGTPVFDLKSQLVCLSGTSNQCFTISEWPVARFRRGLKDDPDDPDDEGADISSGIEILGIAAGVGIVIAGVIAGTATTIFYLATYLKARSMGMPASVFWAGILSLQYCGHCNSNSATYAIIGLFCCPTCLCPLSAYMAASNWIEDYAASNTEQAPIIQQSYPSAPSQY